MKTIWVCLSCGKTSEDRYGNVNTTPGWDESCFLNSVKAKKDHLVFEGGYVIQIKDGGIIEDNLKKEKDGGMNKLEKNLKTVFQETDKNMKCKSFVTFVSARKKGSGTPYQKPIKIYPKYYIAAGRFSPDPDMVECDGDLEVLIDAEMDGECACSSYAVLNIKYKCKKCGNEEFRELPQDSKELSYLMEWYLEELPEEQRDRLLDNKLQRELEHQKEVERFHQESQAKFQKLRKELTKTKKKK